MKSLAQVLHRTPWWALLGGGLALLLGLAVFVTPIHVIRLEKSGATPEQNRAIKREIDNTFSEGALDLAGGIVKELLGRTSDPARHAELERALGQIDEARRTLRHAGAEALRARREAARKAADAAREAASAEGGPGEPAMPAPPALPALAPPAAGAHIVVPSAGGGAPALDIQLDAPGPPAPPLPPELRAQIREKVVGDLYRIGVGSGLILLFIPLFLLAVVSKFFIDRSRAAQGIAEAERREAEYQRMSRQVTQAKLSALQAQVEPHFLYNTLASVQALTEVDPQRANAMTGHLIQYLRNALPKMRESLSTVGQEVELARSYLNILQMRMGSRLAFEIAVAPGLEAAAFPPLMLPSLVENAIKHGLEPLREGGKVTITAEAVDGKLRIVVSDTGRGFGEAPGQGVGLANVRERLAALYGEAGRLVLEANAPRGVRAILEVPRQAPDAAAHAPLVPSPPPPPKGPTARTLAAVGSAERAWRRGLSFAFVVLVVVAAVCAGLAVVGILTGALHVKIGHGFVGGAPGALLGAVGVTLAFAVVVIALAIVLAVVYGLGFLLAGLAIFVPLMLLVALFPVLAPFILLGLLAWWLVRRARRPGARPPPPAAP